MIRVIHNLKRDQNARNSQNNDGEYHYASNATTPKSYDYHIWFCPKPLRKEQKQEEPSNNKEKDSLTANEPTNEKNLEP